MRDLEQNPRLTRQERGQVRRVTNRLLTREHREFPSSSDPSKSYRTVALVDGKTMCNCRGWTIKKGDQARQCKHTRQLIAGRRVKDDGEFLYILFPPPEVK